ncbi:alpha/beta fold hydrolase [Sphingomonas sp.]|uniref:alpha/beta fold hydrolase n=1 Tax=Sphingomonas sp. TaxID=28214 RepID=UPI003D6CDC53
MELSVGAVQDVIAPTALGALRVRVGGEGTPILFWPSLLMDGSMWDGVVARLLPRYRVILVDPPGQGGSSPLGAPFDFPTCADCIGDVLDVLGIDRAHYVGNSWGAMIGGTFAARHPERIGAAVLMNGTASPCSARQRVEYRFMNLAGRALGGIRGPLRSSAVAAFLGPTTLRERPAVVAAVRAALARVDMNSVRWAVESVVPRRPDQRALFATIRTPVLVVAGREDRTFPVAETRAMADAIPNAVFLEMPHAAHLAGLECPEEVADMVNDFIRSLGPDGRPLSPLS